MENSPASQSSAQTTMENQRYSVTSGVTAMGGNAYVAHLLTLYAIRGVRSKTKDIWIAADAERFKRFDDIVIFQQDKNTGKAEIFLMQCKHSYRPKKLSVESFFPPFRAQRTNHLRECYEDYKRIKDTTSHRDDVFHYICSKIQGDGKNLWYILFTNDEIQTNCLSILEKTSCDFFNTVGDVYKFKYKNVSDMIAKHKDSYEIDKAFVDQFMFFSSQVHNKKMFSFIVDELVDLLHPIKIPRYNLHDIVKTYTLFIMEWSRGEYGGFYMLTKAHIIAKLTELLLERYMIQFYTDQTNAINTMTDYNFEEWHYMLQDKNITEISVNYEENDEGLYLLHNYFNWLLRKFKIYQNHNPTDDWEDEFTTEGQDLFFQTSDISLKHEIFRTLGSDRAITLHHVYRALWKTNKIPIILEVTTTRDYEIVLHVLSMSEYTLKAIIINKSNNQVLPAFNLSKTFTNLVDLEDDAYKLVLNKTVELQGRPILLKSLLQKQKELVRKIGVREIMQALTGSFNVGDTINKLPVYHVIRTLPRILINFQRLSETLDSSSDVFIIQCRDKSLFFGTLIELDIHLNKDCIVDYEDLKKMNTIPGHYRLIIKSCQSTFLDQHINDKTIHQLILHDTQNLEWIATKGSIKTINSLKRVLPCTSNSTSHVNAQDVLEHFTNQINIISADPGMGKSVLMDYIAQIAPTDVWVLRINLNEHIGYYGNEHFKSAEPAKHLHYFNNFALNNQKRFNPINMEIFTVYLNSQSVLLLFDGFDEVPQYYRDIVTSMIKTFLINKYRVWLTTRPSMKTYLEKEFDTFAVTLNPFSSDEQLHFLTQYFLHVTVDDANLKEVIPEFSKQLLQLAQRNLNDWGQQFTAIPLHTRLLVECFEDNCRNYLKNNNPVNADFNLLDLYTKFTEKKIAIAQEKFGPHGDKILFHEYHQLFSLQVLFPKNDLEDLQIDQELSKFKDMESEAVELLNKSGIVVKNELSLDFAHRSFAEYFAAKWLSSNCKKSNIRKLIKKMFGPEYYVARNIFDQLLAQKCPLHTAIIRQQIDEARALIERTPELLNSCDAGGRFPIHLAAAWGTRHPMPKPGEMIDTNIHKCETNNTAMDGLLKEMCVDMKQFPSDDILELTPSNYAVASDSLSNLNAILSSVTFSSPVSIGRYNIKNYIYYSSRYGYEFIIKRILQTYNAKQLPSYINSSLDKTFNRTAAHWASVMGHKNVIQLFLYHTLGDASEVQERDALNNLILCKSDALNQTALHLAVEYKHPSIITVLLSCGANTNTKDKNGRTPLHLAAHNGSSEILDLVLDQSRVDAQDVDGNTSLHLAAHQGHENIVSILLNKTANINLKNGNGRTPLHMTTMKERIDTMHILFKHNSKIIDEVDTKNNTALHLAAEYGQKSAVELLLSLNLNREIKNAEGKVALHLAAAHGHVNIVTLLMSNADINVRDGKGNTPLHLSALRNHKSTVSVLVDGGVDINARNDLGRTALHESTINNSKKVANFLLDSGIDFNARDNNNRTALHLAAKYNSVDVIELLCKKMNVNDQDDEGNTPLHLAALKGQGQAINVLLHNENQSLPSNGHTSINVNATNDHRQTPLHLAAEIGNSSIVDVLLSYGADTELLDEDSNTAIDLANINNHTHIACLFDSKEGDMLI